MMKAIEFICFFTLLFIGLAQRGHRETYNGARVGPSMDPNADEGPETPEARQESLNRFFDEWSKYMSDFQASDLLYFQMNAGERKVFFENIEKVPAVIRGAYSVSAEQKNKIIFTIYDPNGNPILIKSRVKEAIIYVQVNVTGIYTLEFANRNYYSMEELNFGVAVSEVGENGVLLPPKAGPTHEGSLVPAEQDLQGVERSLNDLLVQQKFFEYRKARQNEGFVLKTHNQ